MKSKTKKKKKKMKSKKMKKKMTSKTKKMKTVVSNQVKHTSLWMEFIFRFQKNSMTWSMSPMMRILRIIWSPVESIPQSVLDDNLLGPMLLKKIWDVRRISLRLS